MGARLLNDKFAIQCKAGYAVPGDYGDSLLKESSQNFQEEKCNIGKQNNVRGWIRVSLHPVMMKEEVKFIGQSIASLASKHQEWSQNYFCDNYQNFGSIESRHTDSETKEKIEIIFTHEFT